MKTIYKFQIDLRSETTLGLPAGAEVVHVAMQNEVPMMWILLNDQLPRKVARRFIIVGTGRGIRHKMAVHRGTVFNDPFVRHVLEVTGSDEGELVES